MEPALDLRKLIETAEEIVYSGQMESAETGWLPVQSFTKANGEKITLYLVMTPVSNAVGMDEEG